MKLKKSEAVLDISKAEYNNGLIIKIEDGESELARARAKLAEAEAEIENAEAALSAAQDAFVWW